MSEEEVIRVSIEQFIRLELDAEQATEVSNKIREVDLWQKIYRQISSESQGIRFHQLLKLKAKLSQLESMQNNLEDSIKDEGYLNPALAFKSEIYENDLLKDRSQETQVSSTDPSILRGIRFTSLQTQLDKLKKLEKNQKDSGEELKPTRIISLKKYAWAVAVSLIVIISTYLIINRKPKYTNSYLQEHFEEYLLHDKVRAGDPEEKLDKDKEVGYDLYVLKEFKQAIPYLNNRWEKKQDSIALFYLAVSYAGIGEFEKAEQIINRLNNFSNKEIILNKLIQ